MAGSPNFLGARQAARGRGNPVPTIAMFSPARRPSPSVTRDMRTLALARSRKELEGALSRWAAAAGFDGFAVVSFDPDGSAHAVCGEDPWVQECLGTVSAVEFDPVHRHIVRHEVPRVWDAESYASAPPLHVAHQERGAAAGVGMGLRIEGQLLALYLTTETGWWTGMPERVEDAIRAIGQMVSSVDAALELLRLPSCSPIEGDLALDPLQQQLLSWTVQGFDTSRVTDLADLDRRTALAVMARTTAQLRAKNKWHAAARALRLGLID